MKSLLDLSKNLLDPDPELRPPSAGACLDLLAQSLPHHIPLRVYFACSLTGISEDKHKRIKECALVLRQKAEENGFTLYAPSEHTDPRDTATLSSAEVYWIDRERVASADLLFILADQPSFGVGQEAEIAANAGVPLAIFSSEGIKVSRMLRGVPARILAEVEFSDIEDLGSKAADLFKEHKSRLRVRVRIREREYHLRLGNRVRELRQDRSLSLESLAEETGVETNHLKALETRPEQVTSVSLVQLRRIARALGVSPAEMLRDQSGKDQEFEQTFRVSLSELRKFAKKEELSYHKYETLKQRGRSQLLEHLGAKAARQPARPLVAEDWSRLYTAMIQSGEQGDLF